MRREPVIAPGPLPETRSDLQGWVREHLHLAPDVETALLAAIDAVFTRHERLWQESKQEAIQALSAGFADKMAHVADRALGEGRDRQQHLALLRGLVADLTDKSHRDPKTKLMNFGRFMEQLESFLALEQRGRWCAVGLVDITGFKWYNDALGHAVGDRIIERVAALLARTGPVRRPPRAGARRRQPQHDRRISTRASAATSSASSFPTSPSVIRRMPIAERFREAVERYDWTLEDRRLSVQPVHVDVGVVCLWLGRVADRRFVARRLAADLIQRADKLMYEAKGERASHIYLLRAQIRTACLSRRPTATRRLSKTPKLIDWQSAFGNRTW